MSNHQRPTSRCRRGLVQAKITGPLAKVSSGQPRLLRSIKLSSSAAVTAVRHTPSKLAMRVRFPSPALASLPADSPLACLLVGQPSAVRPVRLNIRWIVRSSGAHAWASSSRPAPPARRHAGRGAPPGQREPPRAHRRPTRRSPPATWRPQPSPRRPGQDRDQGMPSALRPQVIRDDGQELRQPG